jgi:hypothetical protein
MASKSKSETKIAVLKGQEAEDRVLEYMKIVIPPHITPSSYWLTMHILR